MPGHKTDIGTASESRICDAMACRGAASSRGREQQQALPRVDLLSDQPGWESADEVNWLQKNLEGANLKLASDAIDILGESDGEMLDALVGLDRHGVDGATRKRYMHTRIPQFEQTLAGRSWEPSALSCGQAIDRTSTSWTPTTSSTTPPCHPSWHALISTTATAIRLSMARARVKNLASEGYSDPPGSLAPTLFFPTQEKDCRGYSNEGSRQEANCN